jgi:hypothetical protein
LCFFGWVDVKVGFVVNKPLPFVTYVDEVFQTLQFKTKLMTSSSKEGEWYLILNKNHNVRHNNALITSNEYLKHL